MSDLVERHLVHPYDLKAFCNTFFVQFEYWWVVSSNLNIRVKME